MFCEIFVIPNKSADVKIIKGTEIILIKLIIAVKEIKTYFSSPMAYVVATAFVAVTGFFFVASVSNAFAEATIRGFLAGAVFFLILMAPAITMRLLAEEQKLGTLELLLTSPVKEFEVVFGKFLV